MKFFRRFRTLVIHDRWALVSLIVLLFWVSVAISPLISPALRFEALWPKLSARLAQPGGDFLMGADSQGYSVALLIINGAWTSLLVSLSTVAMSLLVGIPVGALAGFKGGWIDMLISRFMDILLAFPPMILPITITAFLGGGFINVVIALSVTGWVGYARLVRGQFLSIREREFVVAAEALGASGARVMFRHIFPNTLSPLAVQATFALASVIISEAGLSFLGLGVGKDHVSWGAMLNDARNFLVEAPHLAFFPALALFSIVAALNFLGEALRLAFDPRSVGSAGQVS